MLRHKKTIVVDDFNMPDLHSASCRDIFELIALKHGLRQPAPSPTRRVAILNLVFALPIFNNLTVTDLPPVAGSDHKAQLISLPTHMYAKRKNCNCFVDNNHLRSLLCEVDWSLFFASCTRVDEYSHKFTDLYIFCP